MTRACPPNFRDIVMIIELSHLISIVLLDPKNPNQVVLKSLKRKFEDLFGYSVEEIKAALDVGDLVGKAVERTVGHREGGRGDSGGTHQGKG